jgi:hypothetical protein
MISPLDFGGRLADRMADAIASVTSRSRSDIRRPARHSLNTPTKNVRATDATMSNKTRLMAEFIVPTG